MSLLIAQAVDVLMKQRDEARAERDALRMKCETLTAERDAATKAGRRNAGGVQAT